MKNNPRLSLLVMYLLDYMANKFNGSRGNSVGYGCCAKSLESPHRRVTEQPSKILRKVICSGIEDDFLFKKQRVVCYYALVEIECLMKGLHVTMPPEVSIMFRC